MTIPASVTRLQQIMLHTLTASATVRRLTQVADTTGGFTDTYATVGVLPCSFERHQVTPTERETTTGVQVVVLWNFVFAAGVDIRTTDRLVVGTRTFEVVSATSGSLEIVTRVVCLEIT